MHQIICTHPNLEEPWHALTIVEVEPPSPGPGEVVIDIKARPINPADLLLLSGRHIAPSDGTTPVGIEGAGIIRSVGAGVALKPGQLVAIPFGGTWREQICMSAANLIALPPETDIEQASMFSVNPFTAAGLLEGVLPGQTIVINAANSAMGRMIIALCARRQIRVVGLVRRPEATHGLQELGAQAVVVEDTDKLAAQVREAAEGQPVVRALDAVAGEASGRLFGCVADGGELVVYGLLSSDQIILPAQEIVFRDVRVRGYSRLRSMFALSRERREAIVDELVDLLQQGVLYSPIAQTFPLLEASDAVRFHESNGREGKVLLVS